MSIPPRRALPALLVLLVACNTLTEGRKYTMVKMNNDRRTFVEVDTVVAEDPSDDYKGYDSKIADDEYLGVVLNRGFLRYLNDGGAPEVAIFVRATVRDPNSATEGMVWEKVYLRSTDDEAEIQLSSDAYFPRYDIPVIPPFKYRGQDVVISTRVIELDQQDNERLKELLNVAATTAAAFRPENAAAISVIQTALNVFTQFNTDDIEWQFDFALTDSPVDFQRRWRSTKQDEDELDRFSLFLQPRFAKYLVLKTEHRRRKHVPDSYFDITQHGLRYFLAQSLKLGTLGLFNWPFWNAFGADPEDDAYERLLGRPFAIDQPAWTIPQWRDGQLTLRKAYDEPTWASLGIPRERFYRFEMENGEPTLLPDGFARSIRPESRGGPREAFEDQGYMLLTVHRASRGVDLKDLQAAYDARDKAQELVFQTKPGSLKDGVAALNKAITGAAAAKALDDEFGDELRQARTPEEIEAVQQRVQAFTDQYASVLRKAGFDAQPIDDAGRSIRDDLARRIEAQGKTPSWAKKFTILGERWLTATTTPAEGEEPERHRVELTVAAVADGEVQLSVLDADGKPCAGTGTPQVVRDGKRQIFRLEHRFEGEIPRRLRLEAREDGIQLGVLEFLVCPELTYQWDLRDAEQERSLSTWVQGSLLVLEGGPFRVPLGGDRFESTVRQVELFNQAVGDEPIATLVLGEESKDWEQVSTSDGDGEIVFRRKAENSLTLSSVRLVPSSRALGLADGTGRRKRIVEGELPPGGGAR